MQDFQAQPKLTILWRLTLKFMLSSWRKASAYWSCHSQQRVRKSSPSAEAGNAAAPTYLSDAGEDNQAQSGTVEAMLIWRSTVCVCVCVCVTKRRRWRFHSEENQELLTFSVLHYYGGVLEEGNEKVAGLQVGIQRQLWVTHHCGQGGR